MTPADAPILTPRRALEDRRARPTSVLDCLRFGGRRRTIRRGVECGPGYVDRPVPEVLFLVCFLVVASGLDALLTLIEIQWGATELNPVLRLALERSPELFIWLKMSVTAVAVAFLSFHQLFPVGLRGLRLLALGYGVLLAYHAMLIRTIAA